MVLDYNNSASWAYVDYQYNTSGTLLDYIIGYDDGHTQIIHV